MNAELEEANAQLLAAGKLFASANEELTQANERLNVMCEISRSLVGSLHVQETLQRILSATELMGFHHSFVAGPLFSRVPNDLHWIASNIELAQWTTDTHGKPVALRHFVSRHYEPCCTSAKSRVLFASEHGSRVPAELAVMTLVPLFVEARPWGVVGVGSAHALSSIEMKEVLIFRSLAQNALEVALVHEQAERDARVDVPTGLFNPRHFQQALQAHFERATHETSPLSLLMMDINKFKYLNDDYGHAVGDQVLQAIGQIVRDTIREQDIGCRYGGDEICVLLPDT